MTSFRTVQPGDEPALKQLWAGAFSGGAEYADRMLFHLPETVYVTEENTKLTAMLAAVPVMQKEHRGTAFYGFAAESAESGGALLDFACEQCRAAGSSFAVLAPKEAGRFAQFAQHGFETAFYARTIQRDIHRNIWSQAEFDACPAQKLCELRKLYAPEAVLCDKSAMIVLLTELYSRGITVVSSDEGYGLYYRSGETLRFIELMADGDRAAESLMEAAREKEVVVEKAEITIGSGQNLFLGEGSRAPSGMIRFFGEPLDLTESYLCLLVNE